jgi:hypothetical protein
MPGLALCALEGRVEADLDDLVIGAAHRLAHADDPRMGDEVDEAAEGLRVDLDIPASRSPSTAPPGRWIASQKALIMSSRMASAQSREKATFSPTMPSR